MDPIIIQFRKTSPRAVFPEQLGPGSTLYRVIAGDDIHLNPHSRQDVDLRLRVTIPNQFTHIRFTCPVSTTRRYFMVPTTIDFTTTDVFIPMVSTYGETTIDSGTTIAIMEVIAPGEGGFIVQNVNTGTDGFLTSDSSEGEEACDLDEDDDHSAYSS